MQRTRFNILILSVVIFAFLGFLLFKSNANIPSPSWSLDSFLPTNNFSEPDSGCLPSIQRPEFYKLFPDLKTHTALEIGPWASPAIIRSKDTKNVKYFDVWSQEDLKERAKSFPSVFTKEMREGVPFIDYVDPKADLGIVKEKFDMIYSSHNIEHQLDFILHLKTVESLLEENGKFFLAIPDKRYCFDHFIPETRISDVLAVHWNKEGECNSLSSIFKICEATHNVPSRHWAGDHGQPRWIDDPACYSSTHQTVLNSKGEYIDSHKWRFTPMSFRLLVDSTYSMKLQPLKVENIFCTPRDSPEFFAVLSRS